MLRFLFTEINYGGRVTDDKDRRLINSLVLRFCGPEVLRDGYLFSSTSTYFMPTCETAKEVGSAHRKMTLSKCCMCAYIGIMLEMNAANWFNSQVSCSNRMCGMWVYAKHQPALGHQLCLGPQFEICC